MRHGFSVMLLAWCVAWGWAATLPQTHPYQVTLRDYVATLTEADLTVPTSTFTNVSLGTDKDVLYRMWLLRESLKEGGNAAPRVGAARLPASQFLLTSIEGETDIMRPAAPPDGMNWLAGWDYAGNPFYDMRAVKLRSFVVGAIDMMMLDEQHETNPGAGTRRSDYLGGTLIWLCQAYQASRDILPEPVRQAFAEGLIKLALRMNAWGPTGIMTDMDLFAAVSMSYIHQLFDDPELQAIAQAYVHNLFTNPSYFNQAGYFVDVGCFDVSYNGISLYFGNFAAMVNDWDIPKTALDKAYRLRAHLSFPEPDNTNFFGPNHMSSRTTSDSYRDQWNWSYRNQAGAQLTDEAMHLCILPSDANLNDATANVVTYLNNQLNASQAAPTVWKETHWTRLTPYQHDFYRPGTYARRKAMQDENSPMLVVPWKRPGDFIRPFEKIFMTAKFAGWGGAVHTGPVSGDNTNAGATYGYLGPYGMGGGQLSVFWTPGAGSVILGRRGGNQGPGYDTYPDWRRWASHAVSGVTPADKVFTSARIRDPQPVYTTLDTQAVVEVSNAMPQSNAYDGTVLSGTVNYARTLVMSEDGVAVESRVTGDGTDQAAELYEIIPVYLRDTTRQAAVTPTVIDFKRGDAWEAATTTLVEDVTAVRMTRFGNAAYILFAAPQRAKLSPSDWADQYGSKATCRNVMVDLLGSDSPITIGEHHISYIVSPYERAVHTITAGAGAHGRVTPGGVMSVLDGGSMTFAFTPDPGYEIADVQVDGVSVGTPASYTVANVTAHRTLTVTFSSPTVRLEVASLPSGVAITGTPEGVTPYAADLAPDTEISLEAPSEVTQDETLYTFVRWMLDDVAQPLGQTTLEFTLTEPCAAQAMYTVIRQPDLWLRAADEEDYVGENLYLAEAQRVEQQTPVGTAARFDLLLQNDGDGPDSFRVVSDAASSGWTARFLDAVGGEITAALLGDGWQTPLLAAGATMPFHAEVTPNSHHRTPLSLSLDVTAVSQSDSERSDTVRLVTRNASLAGVTLAVDLPSPQPPLQTLTLTATAVQGDNVEYRFFVIFNGVSTTIRPYAPDAATTYTPMASGQYQFIVWAREVDSKVSWQCYDSLVYRISTPLTGVALALTPPSPQCVGAPITLTATPSGGGLVEYRFFAAAPGGPLTAIRAYGPGNTCAYTPTTWGRHQFVVWAREVGSRVNWQVYASVTSQVLVPITGVTLHVYPPAPQPRNTPLTLTAQVEGGVNVQYRFFVCPPGDAFVTLQPYTLGVNTCTYTPPASGVYTFLVWVREVGSTIPTKDAYATFTYRIP